MDSKQISAVDYLFSLDLSRFVDKSTMPILDGGYGWDKQTALIAESRYKKWLYLVFRYGVSVVQIEKHQDLFWHLHILDTLCYAYDCKQIFGKILHHNPFPRGGNAPKILVEDWCKDFSK